MDEWLYNTKLNLDMSHIPIFEQVQLAATYLKEAAQQYYRHITTTDGNFADWNAFQASMRLQFLPPNYNANLLISLEKLKQVDSVEKYINDYL